MTIEETFEKLDELLERLNKPASLEEAFSDYEEGVKLVNSCAQKISEIEAKVMALQTGEEKISEEDNE